jgi:hypothetical protein
MISWPQYCFFLIVWICCWHLQDRLQDWLRKSKRLIIEEATKNKSFDLNNGTLFHYCFYAKKLAYVLCYVGQNSWIHWKLWYSNNSIMQEQQHQTLAVCRQLQIIAFAAVSPLILWFWIQLHNICYKIFVDVVMTVRMMNINSKCLYLALGSWKRRVQYNIFRGYDPYLPWPLVIQEFESYLHPFPCYWNMIMRFSHLREFVLDSNSVPSMRRDKKNPMWMNANAGVVSSLAWRN